MKVTDVRAILLAASIDRPVRTSFGVMERRYTLLVEILTDEGVAGLGEIWCNFPAWKPSERIALVDALRPALLGEDPADAAALWERLKARFEVLGLQWGAPGPILHVLSGIDIALWDAAARAAGVPLYRYLGGTPRTDVPVYASGLGPDRPEELAARYRDMGVQAFKLKVGFGLERDLRNARTLRAVLGPDARLMVDANQAWSPRDAVDAITRLSEFDLWWVEEPVRCNDLAGLAQVRLAADLPVAAGENLYGLEDVARALDLDAVDILQPDVTKTAGITESRAIVRLAAARGKRCALHFLGGAIGLVASIHLTAAGEDLLPLELDANPNPLREALLAEPLTTRNGALLIPQGPGLGVSLDPVAVERYRVDL